MSSHYLDFSSCGIVPGFCKSGHKYATVLYHKINVRRSTFYMESFMLFSKSAHLLDYAALLYNYVATILVENALICIKRY